MRVLARAAAVIAAAIACGWALVRWAYAPHACNVAITDLTRRTSLIAESRMHYQRFTRAKRNIEELRAAGERCATDVRVPMLIAANEEDLGRYDDAVRSYGEALRINQRPEIHTALADALIQLGRTDEAVEHYVLAARFNPGAIEHAPSEEVQRRATERLRAGR